MPKYTLYYFDLAGRAEVCRLLFTLGGIEFDDKRLTREEWAEFKPKTPFGQLPVLEVDGKMLAQSGAIDRYVARVAGLTPEDPWAVALNDEVAGVCGEVTDAMAATMRIQDPQEKLKARQGLLEGLLRERLTQISKQLEGKAWVSGDMICYGDLYIFQLLSWLSMGILDGIPKDLLDSYPVLKAFKAKVVDLDAVKNYYVARGMGAR